MATDSFAWTDLEQSNPRSLPPAFRQRCEAIATSERYALQLKAFNPLPARQLAAHHHATLLTPLDLTAEAAEAVRYVLENPGWSAALLSKQPPLILHNPLHSVARQEANLMHELAHLLLNHPLPLFVPASPQAAQVDAHEREAEYLGSCLQIPQRGLAWASQRQLTLQQTAEHFGASIAMVRCRCNATGLMLNMD
jgi:Zn-dependent peptidase ImmA (M78 family)